MKGLGKGYEENISEWAGEMMLVIADSRSMNDDPEKADRLGPAKKGSRLNTFELGKVVFGDAKVFPDLALSLYGVVASLSPVQPPCQATRNEEKVEGVCLFECPAIASRLHSQRWLGFIKDRRYIRW